jgi:glycerol kinase
MQSQPDILNRAVVKTSIIETTVLGGAYAAGLGTGLFKNANELCSNWSIKKTLKPEMDDRKRESMYRS